MINNHCKAIISRALKRKRISTDDVRELQREVFQHGLLGRDDVAVLAGLDRRVATADELWAKFFVTSVVEFVVWTSRPTGYVDQETAQWLLSVIMPGGIATVNAHRVVLGIIREAQQVDGAILVVPRETASRVPGPDARLAAARSWAMPSVGAS